MVATTSAIKDLPQSQSYIRNDVVNTALVIVLVGAVSLFLHRPRARA